MDARSSVSSELKNAEKLFKLYMLCSSILIFKIMGLLIFTVLTRMRNKVSLCSMKDEEITIFIYISLIFTNKFRYS